MRLKQNLKLRRIGSNYMIVDLSSESVDLANVFSLNETAADIWQAFEGREFTSEQIADYLCQEYEVAPAQALSDTANLIETWSRGGLIL